MGVFMMKHFALLLAAASLTAVAAPTAASAQTYSSNFTDIGLEGAPAFPGYYYFVGHDASQTFSLTGLTSVTGLDLQLNAGPDGNYVTEPLTLTFLINGSAVGTTTYNPGDPAGRLLSFVFSPILDGTQTYELTASVTGPVCVGCGAVNFSTDSPFTLFGAAAVPEPSTWAMMLFGFGMVGFSVRRQRRVTGAAIA